MGGLTILFLNIQTYIILFILYIIAKKKEKVKENRKFFYEESKLSKINII